jgi:hypothetical protein
LSWPFSAGLWEPGASFDLDFGFRRLFNRLPLSRDGVEGLLEVGDEVFDIFQPHTEAREATARIPS